jgi:hypothetical protein
MDAACGCIFTANKLMENANVADTSGKQWNRKDNHNAVISVKEHSIRGYSCTPLI